PVPVTPGQCIQGFQGSIHCRHCCDWHGQGLALLLEILPLDVRGQAELKLRQASLCWQSHVDTRCQSILFRHRKIPYTLIVHPLELTRGDQLTAGRQRSEEHTSELQSRENLV